MIRQKRSICLGVEGREGRGGEGERKEGTKEAKFTDSREKEDEKRSGIRRLDEARRVVKKRRYEI